MASEIPGVNRTKDQREIARLDTRVCVLLSSEIEHQGLLLSADKCNFKDLHRVQLPADYIFFPITTICSSIPLR